MTLSRSNGQSIMLRIGRWKLHPRLPLTVRQIRFWSQQAYLRLLIGNSIGNIINKRITKERLNDLSR